MPNSSRALPASRIISRSESLPITIDTCGLLIIAVRFHPYVEVISIAVILSETKNL